jgi:hypothetical protein
MAKREGVRRQGTRAGSEDDTSGISRLMERGFAGGAPGQHRRHSYSRVGGDRPHRGVQVGGQSLRERLMAREAELNGWTGSTGSDGRQRRQEGWRAEDRGRGPEDIVQRDRAVVDMSRSELEAVLRKTGTPVGPGRPTKERMQELILARMTKDEMLAQCRLLGLDTSGTKVELKSRILASKTVRPSSTRRDGP